MAPKGGKDSRGLDGFSSAMKEAWYFLTIPKKKSKCSLHFQKTSYWLYSFAINTRNRIERAENLVRNLKCKMIKQARITTYLRETNMKDIKLNKINPRKQLIEQKRLKDIYNILRKPKGNYIHETKQALKKNN